MFGFSILIDEKVYKKDMAKKRKRIATTKTIKKRKKTKNKHHKKKWDNSWTVVELVDKRLLNSNRYQYKARYYTCENPDELLISDWVNVDIMNPTQEQMDIYDEKEIDDIISLIPESKYASAHHNIGVYLMHGERDWHKVPDLLATFTLIWEQNYEQYECSFSAKVRQLQPLLTKLHQLYMQNKNRKD